MLQRTVITVSILLSSVGLFAARAAAQCSEWAPDFHFSGPDTITNSTLYTYALESFDDGTGPALYLGGRFDQIDGQPASNIARWNGSSWSPMPSPAATYVFALITFDDGTGPALYASAETGSHLSVARWNGSSWNQVGGNFDNGAVLALAVYDDGSGPALYAGGTFSTVGGVPASSVAKWNGTAWTPLASGITGGYVTALSAYDDGTGSRLVAGGQFTTAGGSPAANISEWNGSSWSALGAGITGSGHVYTLGVFDPGTGPKLIAGGNFQNAGGIALNGIAAWNGSTWSTIGFGTEASGKVTGLEVFDDGTGPALYATGTFNYLGGVFTNHIGRWNGSTWSAVGAGLSGPDVSGSNHVLSVFDEGHGARLFAAGEITQSGSEPANWIARWDGSAWSALTDATTTIGPVNTIERWDDGTGPALYVGGAFDVAGGQFVHNVAKFDGAHWTALGSGLPNGNVSDLQPFDDGTGVELYACGTFSTPGSYPGQHTVARWNGSAWIALLPNNDFNGYVNALAVFDSGAGPELYAGGLFTQIGAVPARGIAKWTGSGWVEVAGGVVNSLFATNVGVYSFCVWNDGTGSALFVGGQFDTAGGVHSGYIAKWNGANWSSLADGLDGPNPTTIVHSLVVWDDGTGSALFAAGNFLGASNGAVPAIYLGKWNGSAWSTVGNGTNAAVSVLGVADDGTGHGPELYAGGSFTDASGVSAQHVARWNGASFSALSGGFAGDYAYEVNALVGFDGDLYAGGHFTIADGHASKSFARFVGCGQTGKLYCFGDGSGTACPCGNASAVGDRVGCLNSLNIGSSLRASGEPSLAHDSLVLAGAQTTNGSASYFQGTLKQNGGAGTPFGDGLRCAGGSVHRLGTKTPAGGLSQYPLSGDASISIKGTVLAPGTRTYQVRYRNSASYCTSATFNLTNGVEITWGL